MTLCLERVASKSIMRGKPRTPPSSDFGRWIDENLGRRGISMRTLADMAGTSQPRITQLRQGDVPPKDMVERLAQAFTPDGADERYTHRLLQEGLRAAYGIDSEYQYPSDRPGGGDIIREESSPYRLRPDGAFELVLPEGEDEDFSEDPETWPQEFQDIMSYSRDLTPAQRAYIFRLWREQIRPHAQIARDMRSLTKGADRD